MLRWVFRYPKIAIFAYSLQSCITTLANCFTIFRFFFEIFWIFFDPAALASAVIYGQTCNRFNNRLSWHRSCFKTDNLKYENSALSVHIFNDHVENFELKLSNFEFGIIKQVIPSLLDRTEDYYIWMTKADINSLNRYKVTK